MSMLAFFPWLQIQQPRQFGPFRLVCFNRGRGPAEPKSEEQRILDAVLAPYKIFTRSVEAATIVELDGRSPTTDLSDAERNDLFVLSQLVTVGGLAAREFCGHTRYCNSTDFAFMIQSFTERPNGTFFGIRRRDGTVGVRVTADAYQVIAPPQISDGHALDLDAALIEALLRARGHACWGRLYGALAPFIRANTDSADVAEQAEVVDMVGAFEKALGVWGSEDLRREFEAHFLPTRTISPRDAPRVPPARRNGSSVRRLWMGDFYELRNAHSHGDQDLPQGLMWTREEHLLLGAYAFSLLIKSLLSRSGLYTLTRDDQRAIDLFEIRARSPQHLWTKNEEGGGVWSGAYFELLSGRAAVSLTELLKAAHEVGGAAEVH